MDRHHDPGADTQTGQPTSRIAYSVLEVLAGRPIVWPLTLPMCAPVSDGAAAAVLCTEAGLRRSSSWSRSYAAKPENGKSSAQGLLLPRTAAGYGASKKRCALCPSCLGPAKRRADQTDAIQRAE
ncbi:hypothetical protein [Novosphingobium sp.]|uniref:hypothetical protein n=1 Tax=Novosphingobium sp. TaxID=1874826 RepID=UPI003BA94F6B